MANRMQNYGKSLAFLGEPRHPPEEQDPKIALTSYLMAVVE
jgi:hypothetical protein